MKLLKLLPILLISQNLYAGGNTGGMDAGGGGTLPTQHASIYQIQDIATESKPTLLFLLNYYEYNRHWMSDKVLMQKLFDGPRKAQDVLKDLRLEVRMDRPCYTSNNTEVDGSIYGAKPNTICISADRISKKVDRAIAEREVIALLMHEVSHFMGSTETEAETFQEDISYFTSQPGVIKPDLYVLRMDFEAFEAHLRSAISSLEESDVVKAQQALATAVNSWFSWTAQANKPPYMAFGARESQYQDILQTQMIWAGNYLLTLIPDSGQQQMKDHYERMFKGREFFEANEEVGFDARHLYRNEKIAKLHSPQELLSLLQTLKNEFGLRSRYLYQATFGNRWMNLDGHLTVPVNPWEKFQGHYTVESTQCNSKEDWKLTGVSLQKTANGLEMRRESSTGYATDVIEFGGAIVNGVINNLGESEDGTVFLTLEDGGNWSPRNFQDSHVTDLRLKVDGQVFTLSRTFVVQAKDVTKPDQTYSCVYTGRVK